jgi:hypothetical protein
MDRFHNSIPQARQAPVCPIEFRYPFVFGTRSVLPTNEVQGRKHSPKLKGADQPVHRLCGNDAVHS